MHRINMSTSSTTIYVQYSFDSKQENITIKYSLQYTENQKHFQTACIFLITQDKTTRSLYCGNEISKSLRIKDALMNGSFDHLDSS